ncbi:MAG: prepilin-type N-terminal cleavage/methylation domain-containing protein [Bacteroidota bacterium]
MKGISKKIAAFTLTEMLVVLTISAVVATLAFSILSLVDGNLRAIQRNYELHSELSLLQQQFTVDFNTFHDISFHHEQRELIGKTPLDSVVYLFSEKVILRNRDTIFKTEYNLNLYHQGQPVFGSTVDALKLDVVTEIEQSIFIFKLNDAAHKLKNYGN